MTTFQQWLHQQHDRNDRIGDLARDVAADPDAHKLKNFAHWVFHLHQHGASRAAHSTLLSAWLEYTDDQHEGRTTNRA